MESKARRLRKLLEAQPIVRVVGAHNGLGAKLVERHGFDAVWASGLELSTSCAVPDANLLTMTECLAAAQEINESTELPVLCDCDTGYGNAAQVIRMVKKYEAVGLAGVVIEDKPFPKTNSLLSVQHPLVSIEEFVGKLEAAKEAQESSDFLVVARIEALIAGLPLDEALKRARAYEAAGADAIVIHSKAKSPEEVYAFAKQWQGKVPLVAIPTTYCEVSADNLARHGFKMVIYANHALRASIRAMEQVLARIRETDSTASVESQIASLSEVFELQGLADLKREEKRFLKTRPPVAVIPAARDHRFQPDLKELLQDRPLCMLELGGRFLIERQMDALRAAGIGEIYVIGGHLHERIRAEGARILYNPDYAQSHCTQSILMAKDYMAEGCLVVYSDILFDHEMVERLVMSPYPITLVVDRAYQGLPYRDKALDLVQIENSSLAPAGRALRWSPLKPIERIGKGGLKTTATHEFIGMVYFRPAGVEALLRAWAQAQREFVGRPFYEAQSVLQADLTDVMQYLLDQGIPVMGMEIEAGWSELHSLDDYRRALAYFQAPLPV